MINHETKILHIENLHIPVEDRIGEEGQGFSYILSGMNTERLLIAAECIGNARFFIEKATEQAKVRKVFSNPIGTNQGVQFPLAAAYAQTEAADIVRYRVEPSFDAGFKVGPEAKMSKYLWSKAAQNPANMCMDTFGCYGMAIEYHIESKFCVSRLYEVAPISKNLTLTYLGHNVLGMPKSCQECNSKHDK